MCGGTTDTKSSPVCLTLLVVVSYSISIQNWCRMLSWRRSSSSFWFLLLILYKTKRIPFWHPLPPRVHISLFNSYTKLMNFLSWSTFDWPLRIIGFPLFLNRHLSKDVSWGGYHIYIYICIHIVLFIYTWEAAHQKLDICLWKGGYSKTISNMHLKGKWKDNWRMQV